MNRRTVTAAVAAALATTGKAVGTGQAPDLEDLVVDSSGRLIEPYSILYPLPGVPSGATYGVPEGHWQLAYQVTSVGARDDHAQAMADLVRGVMTDRAAGGAFATPITPDGAVVIDRRTETAGGPQPAGGGLWQVVDIFTVELTA